MNHDWKQLYGPTPQAFEQAVRRAAAAQPAPRRSHRRTVLILAVTLTLALSLSAAIATQVDLLSALDDLSIFSLTGRMQTSAPTLTASAEYPYAEFSLVEAMTDGYLTWYQLKVTPKNGAVVMPDDAQPHDSTQYDIFSPSRQPEGETFKSRALATGGPLVQFDLHSLVIPNQYGEDGSVTIAQSTPYTGQTVTIPLRLSEISIRASRSDKFVPHEGATASLELTFDLPATSDRTIYTAQADQWVEALQTTVQQVSFIQTPIAVYLRVTYEPGEAVLRGDANPDWGIPYRSLLTTMKISYTSGGKTDTSAAWYPVEDRLHESMQAYYHMNEIPTDIELHLYGQQTAPDAERLYATIPLRLTKAE